MRRNVLILVISCLACVLAIAQSHKERFIEALNAKDMAKAEEILKAWDKVDANDPNLYIAYFNYYTVKSRDAVPLVMVGYDKKYIDQALGYISDGIMRFPTRFDMRVAKIYMLGELKDYPAYVKEVLNLIVYSDKIKNNWKGEDFTILDFPEEMFFGAVLDFQQLLFNKKDPSLYKDIFRISDEMLKYYPKHVQTRLNNSTVYIEQKEYDKSLAELMKGLAIEPANAILQYNLGYVYTQKGDKVNAKKYYELAVKNCNEKEEKLKVAAQQRLEALK